MPASNPRHAGLLTGILITVPALTLAAANPAGTTTTPKTSTAAPAVPAGDVLAQGGGLTLSSADVRTLVAGMSPGDRAELSTNLPALEQMVRAEIVRNAALAEAKSKGFDRQSSTLKQLERVRDEALVRLWIADQAAVPPDYPNAQELQAAYDQYKDALATPTQYHIAQIFISAPDGMDAGQFAAALKKEADVAAKLPTSDFAQLAKTQSEHAESAAKGGDIGFVSEDHLMPAIATAVRALKVGGVAGPIKSAQGIHFVKLVEIKPGAVPTLAESHDRLVAALRSKRAEVQAQKYLTDYTAKLGVTVNQIELAKLQQSLPH